jgi:MGT family glycosyltransferase
MLKLAVVSVPFSGHFKILSKMAREVCKNNKNVEITFIITGWENIKISDEDRQLLISSGIKVIELNDKALHNPAPMNFTLPRANNLADKVISLCKNHDKIIYDFFSLEGYIAGQKLNIPHTCSIPAIIGSFNPGNPLFVTALENNKKLLNEMESKYQIQISNKLEMVSDGFLLPSSQENILWSWESFIKASDFLANRRLSNCVFMRPDMEQVSSQDELYNKIKKLKETKKIIYLSLGTVVTENLWNNIPKAKQFINSLFEKMTKSFADNDKYEVVISTGRKIGELFKSIPKNFHVYEKVSQVDILKLSDVFITHGGGNSVNEAVESQTPMVVIPFFGDQHLCASNVKKLKIGISFLHDEKHQGLAINTEAGVFDRSSLSSDGAILQAVEDVINNKDYKNNLKKLVKNEISNLDKWSQQVANKETLQWKEGDLLYGCNADREKLANITGLSDLFKIGDVKSFPVLFGENSNPNILPRIVDQYHDAIFNKNITVSAKFPLYQKTLTEYKEYVKPYIQQMKAAQGKKKEELLWEMCLAGLEFFIQKKRSTIHFVMNKYNNQINLATTKELQWIKKRWTNEDIRQHVKFYLIQDGKLCQVDPEKSNWFSSRSTPGFFDMAPEKVNHKQWKSLLSEIKSRPHTLFYNHLPNRYADEVQRFKAVSPNIIDINVNPDKAKLSLRNTETHVFSMLANKHITIASKRCGSQVVPHSLVANNRPVLCAGEIRLKKIKIHNRWLNVLDISNDSGHYMPDASGLADVIHGFEKLGFIVHRVNVVHTKILESFNKVEENMSFSL